MGSLDKVNITSKDVDVFSSVEVGSLAIGKDDDSRSHNKGHTYPAMGFAPARRNSSSSQMIELLDEFTKIYADRLQRIEETEDKTNDKEYVDNKVSVLESWVHDLGEQNAVLVSTVEELEKEAAARVALLEDKLGKMAVTTRESCVSLRDHHIQVSSLVTDKLGLEKEARGLGDKLVNLEKNNYRLKEDNVNLQSDLNNLIQVISRARVTGHWETDDLTFSCVTPEQVFGPVLSSSRRSSQSLKDSQRDYIHQLFDDPLRKDNSSVRSSLSNLQDVDSMYGSRGSDKGDVLVMKLKADLKCAQTTNEDLNCQLVERDKQIADLQAQLTEIHHELAESQAEVSNVTHTLQEFRHHNRHDSVEVIRKDEMIRHLLSKTSSKKDSLKGSLSSLCDVEATGVGDNNLEVQLSENIDILASRLAELEDECQQLRDQHSALQDTHSLCAPTITMLQDQLSRSQQNDLTPVEEDSNFKRDIKTIETQTSIDSFEKSAMNSSLSEKSGLSQNSPPQLSQASKLQNEVDNKNDMLQKLENENSSLTKMLNEKSSNLEKLQNEMVTLSSDLDKKKKEVADQRITISTLQDALVASKRTCDDLRGRLENDVTSRNSETDRLEQDLEVAQSLHHQTFTQLMETDAKSELMQEENRALSRRVVALQEEFKHNHSFETQKCDRLSREKDHIRRQYQESERRCQELVTTVQILQGQVQALEEEVTTSTEARSEAEHQVLETKQKNMALLESISSQETTESVERLGHQLEETVVALTKAREEVLRKTEQLRQTKSEVTQLSYALAYEKELNESLHGQMENLVTVTGNQEHKTAEQQQELRKIMRESTQKDRQISTLEAQVEGLKGQIKALEELVAEEQKEVTSLNSALSNETKLLCQTRTNLDVARKEVSRKSEQIELLKKDMEHSQDKISRQEQRLKEMENVNEVEVAAVAERLNSVHEASIRRLEDTLLTYTRLQAHDEYQVENLEESLREVGSRLAESEMRMKEMEKEKEVINRSFHQEQKYREEEAHEHQRQILRLTDEAKLLKARLESVQEETMTWQRQCEDLEERHQCPSSEGSTSLQSQLLRAQHQVESFRSAMLATKLEKRNAEEERNHAHEQVLSLIRECNALEEQIHRLMKEKCRLQDQLSCKESDIVLLEREHTTALSKEELARSAEKIAQLEKELLLAKSGKVEEEKLKQQLKEAQLEIQKLKNTRESNIDTSFKMNEKIESDHEDVTSLAKQLKETQYREQKLREQLHKMKLIITGEGTLVDDEVTLRDLQNEISATRRECSEARRLLIEKENQARVTQIKVNTLQKMLQDQQQEVTELEERLSESQTETHRAETEVMQLRTRVATLNTQLGHAHTHATTSMTMQNSTKKEGLSQADKMTSLENEVVRLRVELAAKEEEFNQMCDQHNRTVSKLHDLEKDVARIAKQRDEAQRKIVTLEGSLAETIENSQTTRNIEKMWEAQLANIQQEVSRLLCETSQLKECNMALHEQLSASQNESDHLRGEIRSKDSQVEELQHARDLLANDAQVVVTAVKQWLHEQKNANSKLANKLHQQNKQILLLNTEKQFLAERNTNMQRANHELSLQLQELKVRLGLPLLNSQEKLGKQTLSSFGSGGFLSPRVLSPCFGVGLDSGGGGGSSAMSRISSLSVTSPFEMPLEDGLSTCSSEGSSGGGCHIPGPDLPGTLQLEKLAQLADSLLLASRNISTSTSPLHHCHKYSRMSSATSLGDLSSNYNSGHTQTSRHHLKRNSSSVGNLSILSPIDGKSASSGSSRFNYRLNDHQSYGHSSKYGENIVAPPVKERRTSHHRLFQTESIEEAAEEEDTFNNLTSTPKLHPASLNWKQTYSKAKGTNDDLVSSPTSLYLDTSASLVSYCKNRPSTSTSS